MTGSQKWKAGSDEGSINSADRKLLKIYLTRVELFQKFDIQQTKMEVKL